MKAKEILLTGDNIDADEAYRIGLINMVVGDDKLIETSENIAKKIASKSSIQIDFIKSLVNIGTEIDLHSACSLEISYFTSSFSTKDQKIGMSAFVEKKKPIFIGK
jgi:enoyl-CoA hydratase